MELKYSIKLSLTRFNGICHTIILDKSVEKTKFLILTLNSSYNLIGFIHEPGFELWSHIAFYPKMPDFFDIKREEFTDIALKKSIEIKVDDCISDLNYNQYKCLIDEYKKGIEKLGMDCVTPWTYSILDGKNIRNDRFCNESEFRKDSIFSFDFFQKASKSGFKACKGNLQLS